MKLSVFLRGLILVVVLSTALMGQSYIPMYAPGTVAELFLWCETLTYPPQIIPYCIMEAGMEGYPGTNVHTAIRHSSNQPFSRVSFWTSGPWYEAIVVNTGRTGVALTYFKAGQRDITYTDRRRMVGQAEHLWTQTASTRTGNAWDYAVGYGDIYWIEEKPQWIHIGKTPEHGNSNWYNHWMTWDAAWGIWDTAVEFLGRHTQQGKIAVNDMALPFGGLFDIAGNWEPSRWDHGRGTAVDVRGNTAEYAVPDSQQAEFLQICADKGAIDVIVEDRWTSNQHIHCRWPDP